MRTVWLVFVLWGCAMAAAAAEPITIAIDRSLSMAGFAAPGNIEFGAGLRRAATILSAKHPVRVLGFSGSQNVPQTQIIDLKGLEGFFRNPSNFAGSTPLAALLQEIAKVPNGASAVVTDGMEDDGAIERLAAFLAGLVTGNWRIEVMSMLLPFDGVYYAETSMPRSSLDRVRDQLPDKKWAIQPPPGTSAAISYYRFRGMRPIFFFLLSPKEELGDLAQALRQGLREAGMELTHQVVLAPAADGVPAMSLEAPAGAVTRRRVRLPAQGDGVIGCPESMSDPLPVLLRIHPPAGSADAPTPGAIHVTKVTPVSRPARWVPAPLGTLKANADGTVDIPFSILCAKPGWFANGGDDRLQIHVEYSFTPMASGWWLDWSGLNSWEHPYKAYKLDYLVKSVYEAAVRKRPSGGLDVNLGLKVSN